MKDRRQFLTTVAVVGCSVATAGCTETEEEPEPDEEPQPEQNTSSPSKNETTSAKNETEDDPAENETEEVDDGENKEEPTQEELLEDSIERAENLYIRGLTEFGKASSHESNSFMYVYPSDTFDNTHLNNARESIEQASNILWDESRDLANTDKQRERVREYRTYDDFIYELGRIQRQIHNAYSAIDNPEENSAYDRGNLNEAKKKYEQLDSDRKENEMYMSEITAKLDQLEWQIGLMEDMYNGLENVAGAQEYVLVAPTALQVAREDFDSVIEELEDPESAAPEDYTDEDLLDLAEEFYEAVDEALREITQNSDGR